MHIRHLLCAGLLVAGAAGAAQAQHARFVLFGDRNPDADAEAVTPEQESVHPLTSPYHNEDAFVTTDVRAWFAAHSFPSEIALGGGDAYTAAAQVRVALTSRLQLVAYKDGYLWVDTPAVDDEGWVDVAAGLKYAIIQDFESQFHWAAGAGYEFPWGDASVFQNDGEFRLFTGVNKGFDRLHLGANFNYFIADHKDEDDGNSDRFSWHFHADYWVTEWFSPVLEVNGFHVTSAGTSGLQFHGADVLNLGLGEDDGLITVAPGVEFRPIPHLGLRAAFEFPVTDEEDIYGTRWTFSAVYSF